MFTIRRLVVVVYFSLHLLGVSLCKFQAFFKNFAKRHPALNRYPHHLEILILEGLYV